MKRFSLVLLSVLICFSMFSCDDYNNTPSASSENTSSETVSDTSSQEVTSSESVSSVEDTSSKELTSSESVSSVEEIQRNENIPEEDKEKAFMYLDTLGYMTLELGWDNITEVNFDEFILWFGYRDQKADNPVTILMPAEDVRFIPVMHWKLRFQNILIFPLNICVQLSSYIQKVRKYIYSPVRCILQPSTRLI